MCYLPLQKINVVQMYILHVSENAPLQLYCITHKYSMNVHYDYNSQNAFFLCSHYLHPVRRLLLLKMTLQMCGVVQQCYQLLIKKAKKVTFDRKHIKLFKGQ